MNTATLAASRSEFSPPVPCSPEHRLHLEIQITDLSAHIHAATYRLLELIREYDDSHGWTGPGLNTCAHWLNWKCGLSLGAAREKVRVAHALKDLPMISKLFRLGEVSYSKVRAMTRVATAENEEFLLQIARYGTATHVERVVRNYRKVKRIEALQHDNERHALRKLYWYTDDDGCLVLKGRFPPEMGMKIVRTLECAMDEIYEELKDVPAGTSRRLACDAGVVNWLENNKGEPLSIGRKTRSIPPAIRRALKRRDHGCRFPGCSCSRFVDAHHITHWADGGETSMDNLVLLCRRHHRLVHEGGFGLHKHANGQVDGQADGKIYFTDPQGRHLPQACKPRSRGNVFALTSDNDRRGVQITAKTGECLWDGQAMDDNDAMTCMLQLE